MRNFVLTFTFLVAQAAAADWFGPVHIEPRRSFLSPQIGAYHEYRFAVVNPAAERHVIRIEVVSRTYYAAFGEIRSSREVVVSPRSSEVVSIPELVLGNYAGPATAFVKVDGRVQGKQFQIDRESGSGYNARDILIGRSVPQPLVVQLIPDWSVGDAVRLELPPAEWSDQWIYYDRFEGMLLTDMDWRQLPPDARAAILRWVSAGGALTFYGSAELPPVRPAAEITQLRAAHHGFGTISMLGAGAPLDPNAIAEIQALWRGALALPGGLSENGNMQLLDKPPIPVGLLFLLLMAFAIIAGPIHLFVLAKKNRRVWMFVTLPVMSIAAATLIVGSVIANEGLVRIEKTTSLTLLDETLGEATTLGWTGFYATFPPNGQVRFDGATEAVPLFAVRDARTDWSDGQRLTSGWIRSRVPSHFAVRKVESRRERLRIRDEAGHMVALNGLGSLVKQLWVVGEDGAIYSAKEIAAGKEVVLAPTGERFDAGALQDPALLFGSAPTWSSYYSRLTHEPRTVLRPGMYLAVLEKSPFVETALEKPDDAKSEGVVIGLMSRSRAHAS